MVTETMIGVFFHDDAGDMRTHELVVVAEGIVVLRTYHDDQFVASVSSVAGTLFAEEVIGLLNDPGVSVVLAGCGGGLEWSSDCSQN